MEDIVEPHSVGLSSRSLQAVDAHVQRYVDRGRMPGAVLLVARRGALAHLATFGFADCERQVPARPDTVYRIYSMTKPVTAVALLQLYERGLVGLNDPVHEYLPSWRDVRVQEPSGESVAPGRAMTLADLLSHQSGLTYGFFDDSPVDAAYERVRPLDPAGTTADMVAKLAGLPLKFHPGRRWNYSLGSDVAGHVVQLVSGQRLDEYLEEHILGPLGMHDTAFHVPLERAGRFAAGYRATPDGTFELDDDPSTSAFLSKPTLLLGGGGLTSTALDYWRFAQAVCNGGVHQGVRVIGRKTLQLMMSNHLPGGCDLASVAYGKWSETAYDGIGFGLGVAVTLDPAVARVSGSRGDVFWGGMAGTAFVVDPIEELVIVFMTQLMPSSATEIRRELRALVYGALL